MSSTPDLVATTFAGGLEAVIGSAIKLDPLGMDRFAALQGARLRFRCSAPAFEHTWIVSTDRVLVAAGDNAAADVYVDGPAISLARLLLRPDAELDPDLQISGNEPLLAQFRFALQGLKPDLAPVLEPLAGPEVATGVDAVASVVTNAVRQAGDLAADQLSDLTRRVSSGEINLAQSIGDTLRGLAQSVRDAGAATTTRPHQTGNEKQAPQPDSAGDAGERERP